jgi:hypothetical protein
MVLGVLALAGTLASPAFADEFSGPRLGMTFSSDKLQAISVSRRSVKRRGSIRRASVMACSAAGRSIATSHSKAAFHSGNDFNQDVFPDYAALFEVPPAVTDPVTPNSPAEFNVHNDFKMCAGHGRRFRLDRQEVLGVRSRRRHVLEVRDTDRRR